MTRILIFIIAFAATISGFAQGPVRFFDTIQQLIQFNPYASGTAGSAVYQVARDSTNTQYGSPRTAIWTPYTNAVPNGTNVFTSPFGGRWIFYDKDDPIQRAQWYGRTNRWSIDHLGNLVLGTTNVAGDLSSLRSLLGTKANLTDLDAYSELDHEHPIADIYDSTPISRAIVKDPTAPGIRAILLLGDSATRNVGTNTSEVASGDHLHSGIYDLVGTALTLISQHESATNPHAVYILGNSGSGTNLTIVGGSISGTVGISLGSDLSSGGSHRIMVRSSIDGTLRTMDLSYFKGWFDLHASNIVDSGSAGRSILSSADKTNVLDQIGTGRGSSLFLRGDGTWATTPVGGGTTNGITDAPTNGLAHVRKDGSWTSLDIADAAGLTAFGRNWITTVSTNTAALTQLALTGGGAITIDSPAKLAVRGSSSGSGTARHRVNIIPGTGIAVLVSDDSVDDEADVTLGVTNLLSTMLTDSTSQGRGVLTNSTAAGQRTVLGLGSVSTLNVASSGDAASGEAVKGNDTRLTNSRAPTSHTHAFTEVVSVPEQTVLARTNTGTGAAQAIPITNFIAVLRTGGLGTGTVTSVSLVMPGIFAVSGSPITNSGSISVSTVSQATNLMFASPASGIPGSPSFRKMVVADLPVEAWTSLNDGTGSGMDSDFLQGQHGLFYRQRANHVGLQSWTTINGTPTTYSGYGITNVVDIADFRAHTNQSLSDGSGVHGISQYAGTIVASTNEADLYSRAGFGNAVKLYVPSSGNATNHPVHGAEMVLANDTRLSDSRTPTSHGHAITALTNVTSQRILGRISTNAGPAEELTFSQIATGIVASGLAPTGTVRSVTLSAPQSSIFATFGNPITNTGTIGFTMIQQGPHTFLGGAASGDVPQFPTFRNLVVADLPAEVWTSQNDGAASLLDAGLLAGQGVSYYLARSNHSGSINWTNVASTPATVDGYGITDALKLSGGTLTGLLYAPRIEVTNGIRTELFRRTESDTPPIGITYQSGSGVPGDSYGWTYPSGTKLSIKKSSSTTTWELMNTASSLLSPTGSMAFRIGGYIPGGGWSPWRVLVDDNTIANYAPTKTGSGASGTWNINIAGNANYASTAPWSGLSGTPTTIVGYNLTDAVSFTDLAAHTNLTAGAHGISSYGSTLVGSSGSSAARSALGLGTSATLNVASSGNAATNEVVKGSDTRLSDSRTPTSHMHVITDISDSGAAGRALLAAANKTNVLDQIGTGRSSSLFLRGDGSWATTPVGGGTTNGITDAPTNGMLHGRKDGAWTQVSMADISGMSVGLSVPGPFSVSGSPVTSSGTITITVSNQAPKYFWAGPVSGANAPPGFRLMTETDLPSAVWTSNNDGTGSGLDADLYRGLAPSYFLSRSNHTGTISWTNVASTPTTVDGYGITNALKLSGGILTGSLTGTSSTFTNGVNVLTSTRTDSAFTAPAGLSIQNGAGGSDTYSWPYPYGGKLTIKGDPFRAWELMNTSYPDGSMAYRINSNGVAWMPWKLILDSDNFTDYSPSLTGFGATGEWDIDISGTAAYATAAPWTGITNTPKTVAGYGITNGVTDVQLAAHTNLTTGAHGISAFGSTLVASTNATSARSVLLLGTVSTLNVATSGDAALTEAVKGDDSRLLNARPPTAHTHPFSDLHSTPATLSGYGITNGVTQAQLADHTNLTTAHGITSFGSTVVGSTNATSARTVLQLGSSATLNVASSGDAASGEVVKGNDSRLTNQRVPSSHSHQSGDITNVSPRVVIGRISLTNGPAEQITFSNLVVGLRDNGGLSLGTVTSVGLSAPSIFNVSSSPVTTSGTIGITLATQPVGAFLAGPYSSPDAAPTFRSIGIADLPASVWHSGNDGSGSGLDAGQLEGATGSYYRSRSNHTGTQDWSTITGTPGSIGGYGITNGVTYADLTSHANATYGTHGISSFASTFLDDPSAGAVRTTLGLGTASTLNAPSAGNASLTELVKGNDSRLTDARTPLTHNHDDRYDMSGTSAYNMMVHTNASDPHPQYVQESNGYSTSLTANSVQVSGNSTFGGNISLSLPSLGSGGSHSFVMQEAGSGLMSIGSASFIRGLLDYHIADIVDSGSAGRDIVKASSQGAILDQIGSGRSGGLFLRGDGSWATPPTGSGGTNGIADAPSDGTAYVRKSAAWTGLALADVSGLTSFGRSWANSVTDSSSARSTLGLVGGGATTIDSPATFLARLNDTGTGAARHRINFVGYNMISVGLSDDGVNDEHDVSVALATGDYGDITVGAGTMTIDNGAVTLPKIQSVSSSTLIGRGSASSGSPTSITLGAGLSMSGNTLSAPGTGGSFLPTTVVTTDTFTANETHCVLIVTNPNDTTITLPGIGTGNGKVFYIRKADSAGLIYVTLPGGGAPAQINNGARQYIWSSETASYHLLSATGS